nr:single-stranded DNA-binding protein [uncultured Butyricicoccus sp.]
MLNKAILMGRLTRDPELRHTPSNMAVTSFTLAIDRDRKGQSGERQTDFIDCVAWGRQAEFVKQWFTKGMLAIVVGRIQSRNWEDRNGNKRVSIEINVDEVSFGETKKSRDANGFSSANNYDSGSQIRPEGFDSGSQMAPAPSFDLSVGDSDFAELDDDSDVPF